MYEPCRGIRHRASQGFYAYSRPLDSAKLHGERGEIPVISFYIIGTGVHHAPERIA